ncbi:MAG: hypothetical protein KGM16_13475 [Bacteroidota bacterium]|nr:hypothetical protein [Bacteroidota bacterium]
MVRSGIFIILFLLLLSPGTAIFAQQNGDTLHTNGRDTLTALTDTLHLKEQLKKSDTLVVTSSAAGSSKKDVLALDTTVKYNPKVAMLRSAILPGWGQWYNKKYWKIPIIYGALGVSAGVFFYNLKTYRLLREAVILRSDTIPGNDALVDPQFINLSTPSLRLYRNSFRQNIDYSVLAFLILWGLNVVDATVDAHLKAFDVSPNITMKVRPSINYMTNAGISLVFSLKDKSLKPLLPLP